jgi:hypothetical protein
LHRHNSNELKIEDAASPLPSPWLQSPAELPPERAWVDLGCDFGPAPLTGLGIKLGTGEIFTTDFVGTDRSSLRFTLPEFSADQELTLQPLARFGDGPWIAGDASIVRLSSTATSPADATAYALPLVTGQVPATELSALFGARVEQQNGISHFALHAPAKLSYQLPAKATALRGRFGLPPGAYAIDNPSPSDGATFIVSLDFADGSTAELFRRELRPQQEATDRPEQSFTVELPQGDSPRTLSLTIDPGPAGNASSDWTYWADLHLETSP